MKRILGLILHIGNSRPLFGYRDEFYALKTQLLEQYGLFIQQDVQLILKPCWTCDQTGVFTKYGKWEACWSCAGTAFYSRFKSKLDRYELGGYSFHIPRGRVYDYSSEFKELPIHIRGFIEHQSYPFYLAAECSYWLFFIFNRSVFWKSLGRTGHCSRKCTPTVIIGTFLFTWRNRESVWRRWQLNFARKIKAFKESRKLNLIDLRDDAEPPF